jgi:myo-inositol-1(or 4)-monophosphatase
VAEKAAGIGGEVISRHAATGRRAGGEAKGAGDYVTSVDRESEEAIVSFLRRSTPDIPILSEEAGGGGGDPCWVIDPLDGTTNFILGFPVVAVSVALVSEGKPVVGTVLGPMLGLEFSAARGLGAWQGSKRLRVSDRPVERAIVATALPFRAKALLPRYLPVLERVFPHVEDVRRAGAAALDLAWVADGVFDAFFELGLSIWDVAAGALLVEEAGGVVTTWDGGADYMGGDIMAGSPVAHGLLLQAAGAPAWPGEGV